jgi:hypothetical protein
LAGNGDAGGKPVWQGLRSFVAGLTLDPDHVFAPAFCAHPIGVQGSRTGSAKRINIEERASRDAARPGKE